MKFYFLLSGGSGDIFLVHKTVLGFRGKEFQFMSKYGAYGSQKTGVKRNNTAHKSVQKSLQSNDINAALLARIFAVAV